MPDVGRVLRDIGESGEDVDSLVGVEPVVSSNLELGARFDAGRFRLQSAVYRSNSDLGSRLDPDQNGFFRVRREATLIKGVDVTGEVEVTERFRLGASYAWLDGRYDSDDDGRVDTDLDGTNIAPNRLNSYAEAFLSRWLHMRFQVSSLFNREFDGPGAADVGFDGFSLADLLFSMSTRAGIIRFGVQNLFDQKYFTYFAQTEPFARSDTYFAGQGRMLGLVLERRF